jgi:hypothetical protein
MPDDTEPIERPEAPEPSRVVAMTVPESRSSPAGTRCEGCPKMGGEGSDPDHPHHGAWRHIRVGTLSLPSGARSRAGPSWTASSKS